MNRRGFLTSLFQGGIVAATLPQIVTFGLGLKKNLFNPNLYWNGLEPWPANMGEVTRVLNYTRENFVKNGDFVYHRIPLIFHIGKQ